VRTEKRGRGRPRINPAEVRTVMFTIRVSLEERELIREAAERDGATASDWARDILLAAAICG
jgi:uncharacterized protein (DUF1778 family)